MPKKRRVAVAIDLSVPLRHHHDVFAGIQRYAREHAHWQCVALPFVETLRKGRGKTGYDGIIARATAELAQQAAKAGLPVVNVWSGSPAKALPSVMPDFPALGRMEAAAGRLRGARLLLPLPGQLQLHRRRVLPPSIPSSRRDLAGRVPSPPREVGALSAAGEPPDIPGIATAGQPQLTPKAIQDS